MIRTKRHLFRGPIFYFLFPILVSPTTHEPTITSYLSAFGSFSLRQGSTRTAAAQPLPTARLPRRPRASLVPGIRGSGDLPAHDMARSQTAASLPDTTSAASRNKIPRATRFSSHRCPAVHPLADPLETPSSAAQSSTAGFVAAPVLHAPACFHQNTSPPAPCSSVFYPSAPAYTTPSPGTDFSLCLFVGLHSACLERTRTLANGSGLVI